MHETAFITGASGGLGEEFARICAADKMDLILVARTKDKLEALASELTKAHGIRTLVIAADLSDQKSTEHVAEEIDKSGMAVTVLINNAGFGTFGLFAQSDLKDQTNMLELNIVSLTRLTRLLLPGMIERKYGKILNIASIAAFSAGPLMSVYYATKAYVLNFSLALSNELKDTGITVSCLCPGTTETGFHKRGGIDKSKLFSGHTASAHDVCMIGYKGMLKGKPIIIPGIQNKLMAFATRLVPRTVVAAIARKNQESRL
jgi:short-subunit dehydrogenase